MKILSILAKTAEKKKLNFSPSVLFHMKTTICLKSFVHDCLWKQVFTSNSPRGLFKLDLFNNFGNFKAFSTILT